MNNLDEKIIGFGVLCKKGSSKGLTQEESREFKKLEKSISNTMILNEALFDVHLAAFKRAIEPLAEFGFNLAK